MTPFGLSFSRKLRHGVKVGCHWNQGPALSAVPARYQLRLVAPKAENKNPNPAVVQSVPTIIIVKITIPKT